MKPSECHWSEVFPGAIPGWISFGAQVDDIQRLFSATIFASAESYRDSGLAEICYIGLVAYFEGFVKYHFASVINICPHLLHNFSEKRPEVSIPIADLAALDDVHKHIGFVIADMFSFSSPKEINGLFRDLIGTSPFSADERKRYDRILHDRHQIVHSASLYTSKYLRARAQDVPPDRREAYFYGVSIEPLRLMEDASFLLCVAEKIVRSSHRALCTDDVWESPEDREMMSHQISFLEWNKNAFSKQEET